MTIKVILWNSTAARNCTETIMSSYFPCNRLLEWNDVSKEIFVASKICALCKQ